MLPIRLDGRQKVTGQKVYARDFYPRDFQDWPQEGTCYALVLRSNVSHRPFLGLNFDLTPEELRSAAPRRIVTAADLERDHVVENKVFGETWLAPEGSLIQHFGQALAILLFDSPEPVRAWSAWLRSGSSPARYGPPPGPPPEQDVRRMLNPLLTEVERDQDSSLYGGTHYVLHPGSSPEDAFSNARYPFHDPYDVGPEVPEARREINRRARDARHRVERDIGDNGWTVLERTFSTQVTDPMFMEPEAGLSWWDAEGHKLHVVYGSQSPGKDSRNISEMFKPEECPWKGARVEYKPCYPGGGFGGRDESSFPMYLALAAVYAEGRPVRLAYDRFEQFLTGIKRHASAVHGRLAYDPEGNLQALVSIALLDGGGQLNLTRAVIGLAALHSGGIYRIPRAAVSCFGVRTAGAPGGSKRGFGIPQVNFAIESLVDEAAARLKEDPIRFRLRHALRRNELDITGLPLEHHVANAEICEAALREPLWSERDQAKRERDRPTLAYGVGFACCMEAYGTSSDGMLAEVSIDPRGEIRVRSNAIDMGQGTATALSIATATWLGRSSGQVDLGQNARFEVLELDFKLPPTDPRHTPKPENSMSASVTAFFHVHAVEEACRVLFDHGIRPAAEALWGGPATDLRWEEGELRAPGRPPLSLPDLAARAHEDRHVTGAMVHTFFQARFAKAQFDLDPAGSLRNIDALAIQRGGEEGPVRLNRTVVEYPGAPFKSYRRSLYASVGHLIAVEVHLRSGLVEVVEAVTFLDAGKIHHPLLLAGQVEGGLAMGIGQALLEEIPAAPTGVDGDWNLHRYAVPRPAHVPLTGDRMRLITIPFEEKSILKEGPEVTRKGIAEATLSTVPAAIHNAIAHATGLRLNRLPMTPQRVLAALEAQ